LGGHISFRRYGVVGLQIPGRNLEINDQVRNHISQKLDQLGRQLPGLTNATVELASEATRAQQDRVVAQVTLDVNGSILRADQRAPNTRTAINSAIEVLTRRIERYKSQTYHSERARQTLPRRAREAEEAAPEVSSDLTDGGMARVKRFVMTPMTVEEAAFQMQLLGHHFYMFLNRDSNHHNVLCQREDGNFGLIQPTE
jgi:putative sigma-54 modulation protein